MACFSKKSPEDTRKEPVAVASREYLGKGTRKREANGDIFAAHSLRGLQLRGFLNVSRCLIALQRAFLSGLGFLAFEHLKSSVCAKLGSRKLHCILTGAPPPPCFNSSVGCLHFTPPFFSLRYYPRMYRRSACGFYPGCACLLLWCCLCHSEMAEVPR